MASKIPFQSCPCLRLVATSSSTGSVGCSGHHAGCLAVAWQEVRLPASKGKQVLQTRWVELGRQTSQASHILARLGERSFLQNRILARQVGKTKNKMATGRDSARGRWRVHTSPREGRLNGNGQHQPRIKRVSCPVTITSSTKGAAKKIKKSPKQVAAATEEAAARSLSLPPRRFAAPGDRRRDGWGTRAEEGDGLLTNQPGRPRARRPGHMPPGRHGRTGGHRRLAGA